MYRNIYFVHESINLVYYNSNNNWFDISQFNNKNKYILPVMFHISFQMAFNVLDCLDYCIKSVASYGELHICHVHSLPRCTIHLLKGTYNHCKVCLLSIRYILMRNFPLWLTDVIHTDLVKIVKEINHVIWVAILLNIHSWWSIIFMSFCFIFQSSAEFYQDLLGTLSESLSMLFRKAHTVQMVITLPWYIFIIYFVYTYWNIILDFKVHDISPLRI